MEMAQKQLHRDSGTTAHDPRMTPQGSLLGLLKDSGGQLSEQTLLMEAPYSTDACRRLLAELEADGEVECHEAGHGRVICLTDATPSTSHAR